MRVRTLVLGLLLLAAVTITACGKKGEPEAPDKGQSSYPSMYPSR